MARVRAKARILENSFTPGNGPYALNPLSPDYNRFASIMAIGDTTLASVIEPGAAFWTGLVTYSAVNEITLTTVEETKGTFGAGTKDIMAGPLASQSMFQDDISGAIVTGGTSTAYTVASYRKYDTLARLDGNIIAFTPHTANGQTVTLSVDGLGNKPLRPSPGVELGSNSLIEGTPYLALYNNTDSVFYLHGMGGNTYGIPLAAGMDYWAATAPSSAFVFPIGQQLSQTTYAKLYALFGANKYGTDAGGLFFLPDRRGRGSVQIDPTGAVLTSATMSPDGNTLGAKGGTQTETLTAGQIPTITSGVSVSVSGSISGGAASLQNPVQSGNNTTAFAAGGGSLTSLPVTGSFSGSGSGSASSNNTGGAAHLNMQPSILCNYIMRVL
jgi:microcystin-dependent protein